MPITQQGAINTTALIVPDLYVQIVSPTIALLNGVPSNMLGIVGTAQWGPKNSPTPLSRMSDFFNAFGNLQNRTYDLGTACAVAIQQGANSIKAVRVTDGTDVAASVVVQTNCITFTSKYTGSLANADTVTVATGSAASSWKVTVARAGWVPEVFDNLAAGLSGNAVWVAIANAINNGITGTRGPSQLIVASAGVGVTAPTATAYTLTGGTDGVTTMTTSVMVGVDTAGARTGMYALRNTGCSVAMLADLSDTTSFATQNTFGLSEGMEMVVVTAAGDTVTNASTTKGTAGIDTYAIKYLLGDWIYWLDTVNNVTRLISPQGFAAGLMVNTSPEQGTLNKQIYGVVGTQKTYNNQTYSAAELTTLGQAGIDVITNPVPGGSYFGLRFGHNASSNAVIHGDNYTRMTNYLAATINSGMGKFIGRTQSTKPTDKTRREVFGQLSAFLQSLVDQNMIDDFTVTCDLTNNSANRQALGYLQADLKVRYLNVVEFFIANLEGGGAVQINRQSTQPV